MKRILSGLALTLAAAAAPLGAQVTAGLPCTLPTNAFGGSGIPTANSMCAGADGTLMGLDITQRYTSPGLSTDGVGNFFALAGNSTGGAVNAGFATWNFDYYVSPAPEGGFFRLFVDEDPALGAPTPWVFNLSSGAHDSSNLGYFPAFNDNTPGNYEFDLVQYSDGTYSTEISRAAVNVTVSATPEPATVSLFATGLMGLGGAGFFRRRRSK